MLVNFDVVNKAAETSATQNLQSSTEKFSKLLKFLTEKNEEVRIFVAGSINYGHQRTAVAVLRRLMILGGTKFRLVYQASTNKDPNIQEPTTPQKLVRLMSGLTENDVTSPSATGFSYTYAQHTATVFFSPLDKVPQSRVTIGFSGGYDDPVNLCDDMQVYFFVILQPFAYNKHNATNVLYIAYMIHQIIPTTSNNAGTVNLAVKFLDKLGFYVEDPAQPDSYLSTTLSEANEEWQRVVINDILLGVQQGTVDLCPVYFSQGRTSSQPTTILFNLITGILNAKARDNTGKRNKTTVILIISKFEKAVYEVLTDLLTAPQNQWGETVETKVGADVRKWSPLVKKVAVFDYLQQSGLKAKFPKVRTVSVHFAGTDPNYKDACQNAGAEGIVIVDLQHVPNAVFEYLFAQGTLPAVFEGEGSASLMLNLGKPFFHLTACDSDNYSIYPDIKELGDPKVIERCRTFYANFLDAAWDSTPKPAETIGQFILDAYTPDTELNQYFKNIRAHFHSTTNDKVHQAIPVLWEQLKKYKVRFKTAAKFFDFDK